MFETGKMVKSRWRHHARVATAAALLMASATPAFAQEESAPAPENTTTENTAPENLLPQAEDAPVLATPPAPPIEFVKAEPVWSVSLAEKLLASVNGIDSEGLKPADYRPAKLAAAMQAGASETLDAEAERVFTWLTEDLRDGRTPLKSRVQWFIVDPDSDAMPTYKLLADALESGDIAGVFKTLEPAHSDYAALREALAATPENQTTKRRLIAANMDRWRWLKRDLGKDYLRTNVPEYMLRFVINKKQISTYRTVVGKPGRTATPQLAESVEGLIFNPTWTVPQSIVKGEGLGNRVLANPAWARSKGYKATKGANGYISVVQKPGPTNSLGLVKLDMPNAHAIFLHDTPSRHLFRNANRALSHGCIRTERAAELAMTIALVQGDVPVKRSVSIMKSLKYTRVPVKRELPVYITYFTMATDVNGKMKSFRDVYGRDKPVFRALSRARPIRVGKMKSEEKVVAIEAPGA